MFFFWLGSNCTKSKFEARRIFDSCLESSLKEGYVKIAWKLEGLSQNCRKIQINFIKQNVFSRIVFLENKRPCINAVRNNSVRFDEELKYVLAKEKTTFYTNFDEIFLRILNEHAQLKIELLRANHASRVRSKSRARSLIVSDLCSETKGSRFESGC